MTGRIKVVRWLAFDAVQEMPGDGHAFTWTARAGMGPFRPLHVVDRYRAGAGSTEGRLFGRVRFMHADDTTRRAPPPVARPWRASWTPASLLPDNGVSWQAEDDDVIVARFDVPPERAEVRLRIDATGGLRSMQMMRWGNVGQDGFGYIPFGGDVHAERRFGDLVIPSQLTIGWWYGTARYSPFFEATIRDAHIVDPAAPGAAALVGAPSRSAGRGRPPWRSSPLMRRPYRARSGRPISSASELSRLAVERGTGWVNAAVWTRPPCLNCRNSR